MKRVAHERAKVISLKVSIAKMKYLSKLDIRYYGILFIWDDKGNVSKFVSTAFSVT